MLYSQETLGGWGALDNILAGIGQGADYTSSAFFETPQRESIVSETTQRAGGDGQTYRPVPLENQSMITTDWFRSMGWVSSPYEDDLAVSVKRDESKELDESVTTKSVGDGTEWLGSTFAGIGTLYEQIKGIFSKGDVVEGTPREGYPEGANEQHTNITVDRGAETANASSAFYNQVKGLFNLAFPQESVQPVAPETHEVSPTAGTIAGVGIGTLAIAGIIALMVFKK